MARAAASTTPKATKAAAPKASKPAKKAAPKAAAAAAHPPWTEMIKVSLYVGSWGSLSLKQ